MSLSLKGLLFTRFYHRNNVQRKLKASAPFLHAPAYLTYKDSNDEHRRRPTLLPWLSPEGPTAQLASFLGLLSAFLLVLRSFLCRHPLLLAFALSFLSEVTAVNYFTPLKSPLHKLRHIWCIAIIKSWRVSGSSLFL